MTTTVLAHPIVAAVIWRAWFETGLQPARRSFELDRVRIAGVERPLRWRARGLGPFAALSEVVRADMEPERTVLLVPPLSGGFPFVMRDMVARFVARARVQIVEWTNARFIPGAAGAFLVDDQAALVAEAIRRCAERPHLVALCQGGGPSLTAAAMTASEGGGPASLSLIASPIRPSAGTTMLTGHVTPRTLSALEAAFTPRATPDGDLRRVFSASAQFAALTATLTAQRPDRDEFSAMILDSVERPESGLRFIDLVTAYMDAPAEFMLDNLQRLYLGAPEAIPAAEWRGDPVDLAALDETPIAVVEGGRDPIAAVGQTAAVFEATPGRSAWRERVLLEEAGHFSLFHGPVWRKRVYPSLLAMMAAADEAPARPGWPLPSASSPATER